MLPEDTPLTLREEVAGPGLAECRTVRTIFDQPDATQVWAQHAQVVEQMTERFGDAAAMLVDAGADLLAFTSVPHEFRKCSGP